MRIHIIGTAGSGKTMLASQLASKFSYPHVELDALYWREHWTRVPEVEFKKHLAHHLSHDSWILDGEYEQVNSLIWPRANFVIWLDYPLPVVLWQLLKRGIKYALSQQNLWDSGCKETIQRLFAKRSIVFRAYHSHDQRRRTYEHMIEDTTLQHVHFLRFRSPVSVERWLQCC